MSNTDDELGFSTNTSAPLLADHPLADTGKFGNPYLRWTIFYAVLIFLIATFPFWMSIIIPQYIIIINCVVLLIFCLVWFSIGFNALNNLFRLGKVPLPTLDALQTSKQRKFTHVVIVPCYLDPIEILFDALGSLLMQSNKETLLVVVAFEAKTPDLLLKEKAVHEAFAKRFKHFIIAVHTVDRANEIAGGCSNKNYALREAYKYIQKHEQPHFHKHAVTLTTCDTDSLFHPNYFSVLEMVYNNKNPVLHAKPANVVWQSPLFYNWDLDERPFFNRVTCLMRTMMMLGGLISFNLNPMSIFSYPLELGLTVGFINPRYGVDDIIAKVRWMCYTNERVPIELLPIPSISGPTIGKTIVQEYDEWSRQIRRWIIGSSESFHYFVIHFKGQPLFQGIFWFLMFFCYYAVLLCCAGIYSVLATLPYPWVMKHDIRIQTGNGHSISVMGYLGVAFLLFQYFIFFIAFFIDFYGKKILTIEEPSLYWYKNLFHWLTAPIVLLWYSVIAFCSIVSFIWKGKKMARHDMAAKEGLEKNTKQVLQGGVVTDILAGMDTPLENSLNNNVGNNNNNQGSNQSRQALLNMMKAQGVEAGDGVGGDIDEEQHLPDRRRSTSTSVDKTFTDFLHTQNNNNNNNNTNKNGENKVSGKDLEGNPLICQLPEKFTFGKYVYVVPHLK
jgi:molecular chaperone GrpE (heat shock protein)